MFAELQDLHVFRLLQVITQVKAEAQSAYTNTIHLADGVVTDGSVSVLRKNCLQNPSR